MQNKIWKKCMAWSMVFLMLFATVPPESAYASDDTGISVSSKEDWNFLVKKCRLDSWSKNKTIVLENDLHLDGGWKPIPIFNGTFDGNGHTITMTEYGATGSGLGLFRYVGTSGTIKNLNVKGNWNPSGSQEMIGGIVGNNKGTISNCHYMGNMKAKLNVGGIAGINEITGLIQSCTVKGSVIGEHYTGGIAGQNLGGIIRCNNESNINTSDQEVKKSFGDLDLTNINSTENVSAHTDTGGITGFSSGILQECKNTGDVGYPHMGYNIGGIVGRQTGYVKDCQNSGNIYGRKDVGGIAGQMEPYMTLLFAQDDLERLSDAFSVLQDIMDNMIDDTETSMHQFSERMENMSLYFNEAKKSTDYLVHRTEDYVDETVETVNDLSQRADNFLADMEDILYRGEAVADDMGEALAQLKQSVKRLQNAADASGDMLSHMDNAVDAMEGKLIGYKDALTSVLHSAKNVVSSITKPDTLLDAILALERNVENMQKISKDLTTSVEEAEKELSKALSSGMELSDELSQGLEKLQRSVESMEDVQSGVADMITQFRWAIGDFRAGGVPQFSGPDAEYRENVDNLINHTGYILDEMDSINEELTNNGDMLLSDMRAINNQIRNIMDIFRDIYKKMMDTDKKDDIYEDISEQQTNNTQGVVETSNNIGSIEGDVNVGGITGSIAVEYDFDPEDDLKKLGDKSLNQKYQTKAVLRDAVNYGAIKAKKDYVGGIVGEMSMGSLYDCQAYGTVTSDSGDYVGGIAGYSKSVIRNATAKTALEGDRYVGGIVGHGTDVTGCRAMTQINRAVENMGAIAGKADGTLTQNYFVENEWGGIDDISYIDSAEPLSYSSFMGLPNIPKRFGACYFTFVADGEIIGETAYDYGAKTDSREVPAVPEKEGYRGKWAEMPAMATFDHVLEAEYEKNHAVIASKQTREDGGKAIVLAEGGFDDTQTVLLSPIPKEDITFDGTGVFVEAWQIKLPTQNETLHTIQYSKPKTNGWVRLYQMKTTGAVQIDGKTDGSYIGFETKDNDLIVFVMVTPYWYVAVPFGALVAIVLVGILNKKRKKQKNTTQTETKNIAK